MSRALAEALERDRRWQEARATIHAEGKGLNLGATWAQNYPSAPENQGASASKANGFNGSYGRGGGDRTRDPHPTEPVFVPFHQPKARA